MDVSMLGLLVAVSAVVVSFATSLFKQVDWSAKTKNLTAVVLSTVAGAVATLMDLGWDLSSLASANFAALVTSVYGISQGFYGFILKGTKVDNSLEAVGSTVRDYE